MDWQKRLILVLTVTLFATLPTRPLGVSAEEPKTVWVYSTGYLGDKGLAFCGESNDKGCIDSLTIDGSSVTEVKTFVEADFMVAGGVYARWCRTVDTKAVPCEMPYLRIVPIDPNASVTTVEIDFRRLPNQNPTSSIGVALTNGRVESFTPATPSTVDVATIRLTPNDLEWPNQPCLGFVPTVDSCALPNIGTKRVDNLVDVLLLPSHLSSAVPADVKPGCEGPEDPSGCWVLVFEPEGVGSWLDTDATFFGPTESSRGSNAVVIRLGGPHYKTGTDEASPSTSDLNLAQYRSFMTSDYLMQTYGLTPEEASDATLPVRRVSDGVATVPEVDYEVVPGGLLITTSGISFSVPTISTTRHLDVDVTERVASSSIIAAAGLSSVQKFYRSSISVKSRDGIKRRGSYYTFSKSGVFEIAVKYKTSKRSRISTKYLTVSVD